MTQPLPSGFLDSLEGIKGFDKTAFEEVHQSARQITSIRLNPGKSFSITDSNLDVQVKVPWSSQGYYLHARPSFTLDPLFHAGAYYVQEASSMFLEQVLKQSMDLSNDLKILDLCAAPGGKSTLIQSLITENSMLVSNEVIRSRVHILAENLIKWGAANTIVCNNDPSDFQRLEGFFDAILVDAPCSGSGMFRKDPAAVEEWSPENVMLCGQRQQRILADGLTALKENGLLVYSTCSYSEAENEQIADWLITQWNMEPVKINLLPEWNITEVYTDAGGWGYRFYPDKLEGEGFFITAFRKTRAVNSISNTSKRNSFEWLNTKQAALMGKWIGPENRLSFFKWNERVLAVPASWQEDLLLIQSALYIRQSGVCIGNIIRDEINPSHDWCVSKIASDILPFVEWSKEEALDFLRLSTDLPSISAKGWVVIKYGGLPLGLVKSMSNRINNYYPKEWRIINR